MPAGEATAQVQQIKGLGPFAAELDRWLSVRLQPVRTSADESGAVPLAFHLVTHDECWVPVIVDQLRATSLSRPARRG